MPLPALAFTRFGVVFARFIDGKTEICLYVHMKTTVVLPDPVFRRAKAEAAMEGRTLRAFVMDAVVHELDRAAGHTPSRKRVRLPLVRSNRSGTLHITGDTVAEAMQAEDRHVLA